jgi:hypothetical protein
MSEQVNVAVNLYICIREVLRSSLDLDSWLSWQKYIIYFPQSLQITGTVPRLGRHRFLSNTFQLIIHQPAYHSKLYSLSYWQFPEM